MDRTNMGKGIMELVGTLLFVMTIQLVVGSGSSYGPIAIGVVFITLVYAGGPISGGHYNPAISFAVKLRGGISTHVMFMYWIAQIVGGYVGGLLGGIIGGTFSVITVGSHFNGLQAFLAELLFTFLLCFVVLGSVTHKDVSKNSYYGTAIGLVVMAGYITVGPISGGAFNPAVALGLSFSKNLANFIYVLTIVGANLLGGLGATIIFFLAAPDQFDDMDATTGETTSLLA